jgi:hypothetical protein
MGKGNAQKTAQARERNAAAAGKDKDKGDIKRLFMYLFIQFYLLYFVCMLII